MRARSHRHACKPPRSHQLSTAGAQCATLCAPCLLVGNSNTTRPQAAPAATDEWRAEREPSLQRGKTEFVLEQWVKREREREREDTERDTESTV